MVCPPANVVEPRVPSDWDQPARSDLPEWAAGPAVDDTEREAVIARMSGDSAHTGLPPISEAFRAAVAADRSVGLAATQRVWTVFFTADRPLTRWLLIDFAKAMGIFGSLSSAQRIIGLLESFGMLEREIRPGVDRSGVTQNMLFLTAKALVDWPAPLLEELKRHVRTLPGADKEWASAWLFGGDLPTGDPPIPTQVLPELARHGVSAGNARRLWGVLWRLGPVDVTRPGDWLPAGAGLEFALVAGVVAALRAVGMATPAGSEPDDADIVDPAVPRDWTLPARKDLTEWAERDDTRTADHDRLVIRVADALAASRPPGLLGVADPPILPQLLTGVTELRPDVVMRLWIVGITADRALTRADVVAYSKALAWGFEGVQQGHNYLVWFQTNRMAAGVRKAAPGTAWRAGVPTLFEMVVPRGKGGWSRSRVAEMLAWSQDLPGVDKEWARARLLGTALPEGDPPIPTEALPGLAAFGVSAGNARRLWGVLWKRGALDTSRPQDWLGPDVGIEHGFAAIILAAFKSVGMATSNEPGSDNEILAPALPVEWTPQAAVDLIDWVNGPHVDPDQRGEVLARVAAAVEDAASQPDPEPSRTRKRQAEESESGSGSEWSGPSALRHRRPTKLARARSMVVAVRRTRAAAAQLPTPMQDADEELIGEVAAVQTPVLGPSHDDADTPMRDADAPRTPVLGAVDGGVVDSFALSGVGTDLASVVGEEAAPRLESLLAEHATRAVAALRQLDGVSDMDVILGVLRAVVGEFARAVGADVRGVVWEDVWPGSGARFLEGSRARFVEASRLIVVGRSEAADLQRLMSTLVHEVVHGVQWAVLDSGVTDGSVWAEAADPWRQSMTVGLALAHDLLFRHQEAVLDRRPEEERVTRFRDVFTVRYQRDPRVVEGRFAQLLTAALMVPHPAGGSDRPANRARGGSRAVGRGVAGRRTRAMRQRDLARAEVIERDINAGLGGVGAHRVRVELVDAASDPSAASRVIPHATDAVVYLDVAQLGAWSDQQWVEWAVRGLSTGRVTVAWEVDFSADRVRGLFSDPEVMTVRAARSRGEVPRWARTLVLLRQIAGVVGTVERPGEVARAWLNRAPDLPDAGIAEGVYEVVSLGRRLARWGAWASPADLWLAYWAGWDRWGQLAEALAYPGLSDEMGRRVMGLVERAWEYLQGARGGPVQPAVSAQLMSDRVRALLWALVVADVSFHVEAVGPASTGGWSRVLTRADPPRTNIDAYVVNGEGGRLDVYWADHNGVLGLLAPDLDDRGRSLLENLNDGPEENLERPPFDGERGWGWVPDISPELREGLAAAVETFTRGRGWLDALVGPASSWGAGPGGVSPDGGQGAGTLPAWTQRGAGRGAGLELCLLDSLVQLLQNAYPNRYATLTAEELLRSARQLLGDDNPLVADQVTGQPTDAYARGFLDWFMANFGDPEAPGVRVQIIQLLDGGYVAGPVMGQHGPLLLVVYRPGHYDPLFVVDETMRATLNYPPAVDPADAVAEGDRNELRTSQHRGSHQHPQAPARRPGGAGRAR